jgi:hypothetical protein
MGLFSLKSLLCLTILSLNRVPKLASTDYLIIDTRGHDVENHHFNLVYKTYVVNEDTQLYKFGGRVMPDVLLDVPI